MVRGGHPTQEHDYRPVVALKSKGRVYNEETKKYEDGDALCSGTVFNRSCVVTSSHCVDENSETIKIFEGKTVNDDRDPFATGLRKIRRKEGADGNDIMVVKLDKPVARDKSLFASKNLPTLDTYRSIPPSAQATIVGYGAATSRQIRNDKNEPTGEWENIDSGDRLDGTVELVRYDEKSGFIDVKPGPLSEMVAPGDSGGPLFWYDQHGTPIMIGVAANMNHHNAINATKNQHVSTYHHADWLKETFAELGCTEDLTPQEQLAEFVQTKMISPEAAPEQFEKSALWSPGSKNRKLLLHHIKEASDFATRYENPEYYKFFQMRVLPYTEGSNEYRIQWKGFLTDPTKDKDGRLEADMLRRNFGLDWQRPEGVMVIPRTGGEAVLEQKLPRPEPNLLYTVPKNEADEIPRLPPRNEADQRPRLRPRQPTP